MSRQELAEAVNAYLWEKYRQRENLSANDIGNLERGVTRWPGKRRREAFRAVLHATTDAELGFYIMQGLQSPEPGVTDSQQLAPQLGPHDPQPVDSVNPANMNTGAAVHQDRLAYVAANPRRVDRAAIAALADVLDAQRRLEDTVGATPLVPAVTAHLNVITQLVREAHGTLQARLVDVAAQWAQFGGWLHLSADQPGRAAALFDRATEWALEAGDTELLATITSFRGHAAWLAGQVGPLIGLTRAALREPTVYVGQRAYNVHQLARGFVLAGEHTAAVEMLAQGADLAAETVEHTGPRPPWHYYRDRAFFDLEAGLVHALLGRDRPRHLNVAVNLLSRGLAALSEDTRHADWTGMYRYYLGTALFHAGSRHAAENELEQLRAIAAATGSGRVLGYVRSLTAVLTT